MHAVSITCNQHCYFGALHPIALQQDTGHRRNKRSTNVHCKSCIKHTYNCTSHDDGLRRPKPIVTVINDKEIVAIVNLIAETHGDVQVSNARVIRFRVFV
jgi:hypothetical protein